MNSGLRAHKPRGQRLSQVFHGERDRAIGDQRCHCLAGGASDEERPSVELYATQLTGYKLANDGQDTRAIQHYLGHRNIQHTTRYTELASDRFKDFWRD